MTELPDRSLIVVADATTGFQKLLRCSKKFGVVRSVVFRHKLMFSLTASIGIKLLCCGGCFDWRRSGDRIELRPSPWCCCRAGCQIGDDTILNANVVIYHDVMIGNRVIIHSGAVIGADVSAIDSRKADSRRFRSWYGSIHDDVEIGACTTVDRGAIGPTTVGPEPNSIISS